MSQKSPFATQKARKGIGGDPKSVKKLRSGDLLIETVSALQSKSFLLAKTFIDSTLTVTPLKSLNSCRSVISEPDVLCASEAEILEGLSDQGVTQEEELEPDPTDKFAIKECPTNFPKGYLRALTPTQYRKKKGPGANRFYLRSVETASKTRTEDVSEEAIVDHNFVRLQPQVQDYVEVRNLQNTVQLLEVLSKLKERYSCKTMWGSRNSDNVKRRG
ncbi:uncharacterized protein TNCV_4761721 [Trichonephila clavipes]|nr:uncharacterized protein TNCV_4761721 [Trichonephila clavipes]